MNAKEFEIFKSKVRKAFADYKRTEGCTCCQDIDGHEAALEVIAKLLDIEPYDDGSGYDVYRYLTKGPI